MRCEMWSVIWFLVEFADCRVDHQLRSSYMIRVKVIELYSTLRDCNCFIYFYGAAQNFSKYLECIKVKMLSYTLLPDFRKTLLLGSFPGISFHCLSGERNM